MNKMTTEPKDLSLAYCDRLPFQIEFMEKLLEIRSEMVLSDQKDSLFSFI